MLVCRPTPPGVAAVAVAVAVNDQVNVNDHVNDHLLRRALSSSWPDQTRGEKQEGEKVCRGACLEEEQRSPGRPEQARTTKITRAED